MKPQNIRCIEEIERQIIEVCLRILKYHYKRLDWQSSLHGIRSKANQKSQDTRILHTPSQKRYKPNTSFNIEKIFNVLLLVKNWTRSS